MDVPLDLMNDSFNIVCTVYMKSDIEEICFNGKVSMCSKGTDQNCIFRVTMKRLKRGIGYACGNSHEHTRLAYND